MNKYLRNLRYDWPLHFVILFTNWLPDNVIFLRLRGFLCRPFFKSCGNGFSLGRNVVFYNPSTIEIGRNVYIAYNCWFCSIVSIKLGNDISFGPGCVVVSGSHQLTPTGFSSEMNTENESISIGNGTWVAANVNITGGTQIGESCLIAAGCTAKGIYPNKSLVASKIAEVKKQFD